MKKGPVKRSLLFLRETMIETKRLILRRWKDSDLMPASIMCSDPDVREFYPDRLSSEETKLMIERIEARTDKYGFGLWAAELKETGAFIGFIGAQVPGFDAHFMPCVEIGWHLAKEYWGKGYAVEGAKATCRVLFENFGQSEVVAMTAVANHRSRRVMEKLGMTHDPADDFDHPKLPEDHKLRRHVLYRLKKTCHSERV